MLRKVRCRTRRRKRSDAEAPRLFYRKLVKPEPDVPLLIDTERHLEHHVVIYKTRSIKIWNNELQYHSRYIPCTCRQDKEVSHTQHAQ